MILTRFSLLGANSRRQIKIIWLQDMIILVLLLASLFLDVVLYLGIYWLVRAGEEPVVLHYTVYFGIDLIGQWYKMYAMPIVGSFIFLANLFLVLYFYNKERVASYLVTGATILAELFLVIGGGLLIWFNY